MKDIYNVFINNKNLQMSKSYWCIVILSSLLSYGFTLWNPSVTPDDEIIREYYESILIQQGRWTFSLFSKMLRAESFLPGWSDFLGVVLMIVGVTLISSGLRKLLTGKVSDFKLGIFASVVISYPYIAAYTVMMIYALQVGIQFFLSGIAFYCLISLWENNGSQIKIICIYCIAIILAGGEVIAPLILTLLFACLLLKSTINSSEKTRRYISYIYKIAVYTFIALVSFRVVSWLGFGVYESYGIKSYMAYDFSKGVKYNCLQFISTIKQLIELYATDDSIPIMEFRVATLLLVLFACLASIKNKRVHPIMFAVCMLLTSLFLYIFTGNININVRMLFWNGIYVGVAIVFSMYYIEKTRWKTLLEWAICGIGIYFIILGSNDLNRAYWADYKTYDNDKQIAYDIVKDIDKHSGSINDVSVIFMGYPNTMFSRIGDRGRYQSHVRPSENIDTSIFVSGRWFNYELEYDNLRIINFINSITGKRYKLPSNVDRKKIQTELAKMSQWPQKDSIKTIDGYILVKMGNSMLEHYQMNRSDFFKNYTIDEGTYTHAGIYNIGDCYDGYFEITNLKGISSVGFGYVNGKESDETITQLALVSDNNQYTIYTYPQSSSQLGDLKYDNSGFISFSIPDDVIEQGKYDVYIIMKTVEKKYIVNTGRNVNFE